MSVSRVKSQLKMPSPYDLIPVFSLVMDILWIYAWQIGLTHLQQLSMEKPSINFISYIVFSVGTYAFTRFLLTGREVDGIPFEELAEITGKSSESLRTRVSRLKEQLRTVFAQQNQTE